MSYRPASKQHAKDERSRKAGYAIVATRAKGECEAGTPACTGRHEVTHHKLPRSASSVRNPRRHAPEGLLACCDSCHRYIHAHPAESYERGWLTRRTAA